MPYQQLLSRRLTMTRSLFGAPLWLFVLALGLRLAGAGLFRLDGLYGQDAFAYLQCAREMLHLHPGELPCRDFYWPWGYPALAALGMLATRSAPFGAQLASVVTGAAIAPLCYWLVMECELRGAAGLQQRHSACAAGLIAACCGALLLSSIAIMSDAAGLFWATLSACLLLRWRRRSATHRGALLLLAAAALALAIITRWIFGCLLLPFGAFVVLSIHGELHAARLRPGDAGRHARYGGALPAVSAGGLLLLIVAAQLYVTRLSSTPLLDRGWLAQWNPINALRTSFDNPEGHFAFRLPPVLFYALPLFHPLYLFPLLTACVVNAAWHLRHHAALLLLGGWIATLYGYLIGIPQENFRFPLALFTPVAVLAGVGLFHVPIPWPRYARARWLLLAAALLATLAFTGRALARFQAVAAAQMADIHYLQSRVPAAATIVTFELSIALDYYTDLKIIDLYAQSPQSLRPLVCADGVVYVYVQQQKLASQWAALPPARNFIWLRDQIGLQQIGSQGEWTLFRAAHCGRQ